MAESPDLAAVEAARARLQGAIYQTPCPYSQTLSELTGTRCHVKLENLQMTGSFKERGAANLLLQLDPAERGRGVVAASAGNHGLAVAFHAARLGIPATIVMPTYAPLIKAASARRSGAEVILHGANYDEAYERATALVTERGAVFVHPFDDPRVVAGQGTLGLELLEDDPDLAKVVVPVGGGGLSSGVAIAVKSARPDVEVVGVQVETVAAFAESLRRGEPVGVSSALTIADGIAVKRPGDLTLPLVQRWLDDVVVVPEDDVAEAMVLCMEKAKLVVEGAGAVGMAAVLGGQTRAARSGTTAVVLSGGNVDAGLLAAIARRHETESGRRLILLTRIPDRPGGLATLLATVAATGANIVDVSHVREGLDLHVRETAVELVLETRGHEHAQRVIAKLHEEGYEAQVLR